MVALSASDRQRFTPASYEEREDAPVFILAPLGFRERGRFRTAVAGEGVRHPSDKEIADTAEKLVEELDPENREELLGIVHAWQEVLEQDKLTPPAEDADDDARAAHQVEMDRRLAIARPFDEVMDVLRTMPRMARLLGMRTLYNEMVLPLAAAFGLHGWENGPGTFRRVNGVVPDDVLNLLTEADRNAIGVQVLLSLAVSQDQRGN